MELVAPPIEILAPGADGTLLRRVLLDDQEESDQKRSARKKRGKKKLGQKLSKQKLKQQKKKRKKKKRKVAPAPAPAPPAPAPAPDPAPTPSEPIDVTERQLRFAHLLRRATYGPTTAGMAALEARGEAAWLDSQLDPESLPDPGGDSIRSLYPEMGRDITQTRAAQEAFGWESMFAVGQATLGLAIWSSRQLFEVMVEFWNNHLNVTCPSDAAWDNRADYDRTVIRAQALGKFSDMLAASAVHPAMLTYLNNASSTKRHPNENYGRELLELHTVGIETGYTEADVLTSARIMTGWTVDDDTGLAIYNAEWHWTGPVEALEFSHPNGGADGRAVATAYLAHLARRRETATRIATKLCRRFVSDNPPTALISRLADTYLANDTAMKPVLSELFGSEEFWDSTGAKIKRPYEDLAATVRVLGHQPLSADNSEEDRRYGFKALYWISEELRQKPLAWTLPTGYPDVASSWSSADLQLGRMNIHRNIAEAWWPSQEQLVVLQPAALLPDPLPATYGELVDRMSVRLVFALPDNSMREAILAFFDKSANSLIEEWDDVRDWRAGTLISLILDSPAHGVR